MSIRRALLVIAAGTAIAVPAALTAASASSLGGVTSKSLAAVNAPASNLFPEKTSG